MEYTDKAAYKALTRTLPAFTSSNIRPGTLAERLLARNIIGKDACESALQQREESHRRRELLINVMGCGRNRAFQNLVDILLGMQAFEWLGQKLIAAYCEEGGVDWTEKVKRTPDAPDVEPTLSQLMTLTTPSGDTIDIKTRLAADWKDFGIQLNFDHDGSTVSLIDAQYGRDGPVACYREMMRRWLCGEGVQPASWSTLLRLLRECRHHNLASKIRQALST